MLNVYCFNQLSVFELLSNLFDRAKKNSSAFDTSKRYYKFDNDYKYFLFFIILQALKATEYASGGQNHVKIFCLVAQIFNQLFINKTGLKFIYNGLI